MNEEIIKHINYLKSLNRKGLTNFFLQPEELTEMLAKGHCHYALGDSFFVLQKVEESFVRVFFYTISVEALNEIKNHVLLYGSGLPRVIDIVGKKPEIDDLQEKLCGVGFIQYRKLLRMSMKNSKRYAVGTTIIEYAIKDDTAAIYDFLYNQFDPLVSQLPSKDDLIDSIKKKEIYLAKHDKEIIGLSYFQMQGKGVSYLFQIAVKKEYRGQGIADDLLVCHFNNSKLNMYYRLWVEDDNLRAINKYKKYGFENDGLIDYVMLYMEDVDGKN